VAHNALEASLVDEVWFVPCFAHRFGKMPAPFADRVAMCELLIGGDNRLRSSSIEKELKKPGHTWDLIIALMKRYPDNKYRLLAGSDIYHEREKWQKWDEIVRLAPPIYVRRMGIDPIPEPTLPPPEAVESNDLRDRLGQGKNVGTAIPKGVLDYIRSNTLYG
jgi:nicotinate-nucleotide adenylyltransferase